MAKNKITDYDTTAANNTDVGGIDIRGSANVRNHDDGQRMIMAHLARVNAGTDPLAETVAFADPANLTKQVRLDAGNVTAGQTRVLTMPDQNVTITAAGAAILDDADAAAQRTTLEVYSISETDTALAAKASLSGATFTGDIASVFSAANSAIRLAGAFGITYVQAGDGSGGSAPLWLTGWLGAEAPEIRLNAANVDVAGLLNIENQPFGSYYFGSVAASGGLASFVGMAQRGLYVAGGSNERVVVPADGEYLIMWEFLSDGTASQASLTIRKNGASLGLGSYANGVFGTGARSIIITLSANDYIELQNNEVGAVHSNAALNSLNIVKVA